MNYRTIVADPPWPVKRLESPGAKAFGTRTRLKSVSLGYPTMDLAEVQRLPVSALAESDAHLYLWLVNAYIDKAYDIVRGWGFRPSTLLTWCKKPMGLGLGGTFVHTTEHVLFARRGSLAASRRVDSTWWQWSRGPHSAKPEAFMDMVESVSPPPRLELFARRNRLGWDTWGNEALEHITMEGAQ
jgi:N6-adenosine-specific RNA methylase IME4